MYLTAAWAAWRYSGNVTGPDSRFSRPTVIGVPVALFGVPSAADASGVGVLLAEPLDVAALLSSLLLPHAASSAADAASVANALVFTDGLLRGWVMRRPRRLRRGSWSGGGRGGCAGRPPCLPGRAGHG